MGVEILVARVGHQSQYPHLLGHSSDTQGHHNVHNREEWVKQVDKDH